jgi:hypothetical protein
VLCPVCFPKVGRAGIVHQIGSSLKTFAMWSLRSAGFEFYILRIH